VTCVVNNAAIFEFDSPARFKAELLVKHIRLNTAAPVLLAQSLHAALADDERGVVINLLDQKLSNPNPDFLSYTLSKSALSYATTVLAQAFAPKVRVVGVAPGITLPSGTQTVAGFARAHTQTPLGRSSTPEDVGEAVVYLASASAVTGATLIVDGGQHLVPSTRDVMFLTELQ
jgi:NAD(P)-dependent dehydrogenase (short-subunit alcohol dehydrogenase family)